jgi:hypothetical protein
VESRDHFKNGANPKSQTSRNRKQIKTMKKLKRLISVIGCIALFSSCTVMLPVNATSNPMGSKTGESKAIGIGPALWIKGNASIQQAAKNGNITKISTVDIQHTYILFVEIIKTKVTGE